MEQRSVFRAACAVALVVGATFSSNGFAQTMVSDPAGVLGRRYVEISGGRADSGDTSFDDALIGGAALNVPVARGFDVGVAGGFSRTEGSTPGGMLSSPAAVKSRRRALEAVGTAYLRREIVSPFVRVAAGYEWSKLEHFFNIGPASSSIVANRDERGSTWRAGFGAEILAGTVAFTAALDYRDEYRNLFAFDIGSAVTYSLTAHVWLTKAVGGFVRAGYINPSFDYAEEPWSAEIGVRLGF